MYWGGGVLRGFGPQKKPSFVLNQTNVVTSGAIHCSTKSVRSGRFIRRAVAAAVGVIEHVGAKFNIGREELTDLFLGEVRLLVTGHIETLCILFELISVGAEWTVACADA